MRLELDSSKKLPPKGLKLFNLILILLVTLCVGIYLGWKNIPGFLKAKILFLTQSEFIPSIGEKNDLRAISLDISFKDLKKIQQKRAEAVKNERLVAGNDDYVKASIKDANQVKHCEVRLKGDLPDHWSTSKWSLRVKMKRDGLVSGMSRFSLQNPVTRNHTYEWLFLENLKNEGLMGVRYDFVNVSINGKKMGIYAIEEYISKEFIEANNRREGIVVSLDEELMWSDFYNDPSNLEWNSIYRTAVASALNDGRIDKNPLLARQRNTAINLLRDLQVQKIKPDQLFDCEKLGKFFALCRLWNAEHCLEWDDINFYYNPIIGKFEPIGFDASCEANEKPKYCFFTGGKVANNWVNYALTSPRIAEAYIRNLKIFSSEKYINNLKANFAGYELKVRRLISRELLNASLPEFWQNFESLFNNDPWAVLDKRAYFIRRELDDEMPALAFARMSNDSKNYHTTIRNSLTQPVEFLGIRTNNNVEINASTIIEVCPQLKDLFFFPQKSIILPIQKNDRESNFGSIEFSLPMELFDLNQSHIQNELFIHFRVLGNDKIIRAPIPIDEHSYDPKSLPFYDQNLSLNSEIFSIKEDTIYLHPGRHIFHEDIFIPFGMKLAIGPDTSLSFERNASLVSEGSIRAIGTPEHPIIFSSDQSFWDGILLFGSKEPSLFENVHFSKLGGTGMIVNPHGIEKDGWVMTGGINVLDAEVHFKSCRFEDCFTEDALNVFSSTFTLEGSKFINCSSDGFDGDFVNGTVKRCEFINIMGDGVDFSGSSVSVEDTIFYNIEDKAISVGEASNVKISDSNVNIANFGIVSKDLSNAHCVDTLIKNTRIAGVSCYQKKNNFGPGNVVLSNVRFEDLNKTYLIQTGSSAKTDGTFIDTEEFLTSSLY